MAETKAGFLHGHAPARARHCSAERREALAGGGPGARRHVRAQKFFLEEETVIQIFRELRAHATLSRSAPLHMSKVVIETLDEFEPTAK